MREWHSEAPCLVEDINDLTFIDFFENYGLDPDSPSEVDSRERVDNLCSGCPFKRDCLKEALEKSFDGNGRTSSGVFGGMYISLGYYDIMRNKHKPILQRRQEESLVKELRKEIRDESA